VKLRHSHIFARAENDHYVEPLWCAQRLFAVESFGPPGARVLDPCCGWGRIVRATRNAGYTAIAGDITNRLQRRKLALGNVSWTQRDFLTGPLLKDITSVVTNPPYGGLFRHICEREVGTASFRVAIFTRLARIVAADDWLSKLPLQKIYLLSPRPSVPPGKHITNGGDVKGDRQEYCWLIFDHRTRIGSEPRVHWLHRDGDKS
jgi:hypothetical protein